MLFVVRTIKSAITKIAPVVTDMAWCDTVHQAKAWSHWRRHFSWWTLCTVG